MDKKTEALLQLLPGDLYETSEVREEDGTHTITLGGVDDPDRELDTRIHYALMLADNTRISIQYDDEDKRVIEVEERIIE